MRHGPLVALYGSEQQVPGIYSVEKLVIRMSNGFSPNIGQERGPQSARRELP